MRIFSDLDGPLLDVSERYYQLYKSLLRERDGKELPRAQYWELKRQKTPERDIVSRSMSPQAVDSYISRRLELIESREFLLFDRLQPGASGVMEDLHRRISLALVTLRNHSQNLVWELEHLGMRGYFSSVLRAGNGDALETKVRLIRAVYSKVEGNDIFVGDTEVDILAARALGCISCAVLNGIRTKSFLQACKPDFIMAGIHELPGLLENAWRQ